MLNIVVKYFLQQKNINIKSKCNCKFNFKDKQIFVSQTLYQDYKIKQNSISKRFKVVVFVCVLILGVVIVGSFFLKQEKKLLKGMSFYAISVGDYSSYTKAKVEADKIRDMGGAGYLYIDVGVSILLFAYKSENDAINVLNNITQFQGRVVELKIKKLPAKIKDELLSDYNISELFFYLEEEIGLWYDYSIKYESGDITSTTIVAKALKLKTELTKHYTYLKSANNQQYLLMSTHIQNIIDSSDDIFEIVSNESKFNAKTKHLYLNLIIETRNMINNFSA